MSRIGNLPVVLPKGVDVTVAPDKISVKGPLGTLTQRLSETVEVTREADQIVFKARDESIQTNAMSGTLRSLVSNMVQGVTKGYEKRLQLVGVGYRATRQGEALVLNVGFSHQVRYPVPKGITIDVPEPTRINVKGASKEDVGQVAAEVRKIRPPEPYKGKGILYRGERIRRKAGKTGKTTGAGAAK